MKYLIILIMLLSNLVFSEEESFFILTNTGISNDGTPSTSIPFREPEEDNKYEYEKEKPSDLSLYIKHGLVVIIN